MTSRILFLDCNGQLRRVLDDLLPGCRAPLTINGAPFRSEDLPRLLDGFDICIVDHSYMPTEVVARCRDLRHVVFLGTGPSSYMDVEALRERGVTVHSIKGYGDTAVAEHAVALMLAAARGLARMDREIRQGVWRQREGVQLAGKRLLIVGFGGIGTEVARIARGIGMEVIAWNRTPRRGTVQTPIEELLPTADVVSLHLALTPETTSFLHRARLARMKRGALLVNTARGALVDEAALAEALAEGRIAGAGLDVFALEPLRVDHPLAKLETVTLSAHSGFRTYEASATLLARALDIATRLTGVAA